MIRALALLFVVTLPAFDLVPADDPALVRARALAVERVLAEAQDREAAPLAPHPVDVGDGPVEIVWLAGSGHGQTLEIGRIEGDPEDGATLDVARLRRLGGDDDPAYPDDHPWALEVRRGPLPGPDLRNLLLELHSIARVRLVPAPTFEKVENADGSLSLRGGSWSSSRDFTAFVRVAGVPLDGAVLTLGPYAGYASERSEEEYVAPLAASNRLRALADDTGAAIAETDVAARDAYAAVLGDVRDRLDDRGFWWVKERLLVLGGRLAAPAVAPFALEVATRTDGEGASAVRSRHHAVTALARLTGRDLRFDEEGRPRPPGAVAEEYRTLLRP